MNVKYTCLYADAGGESHFRDVEVELLETDFAPPAPPMFLSPFIPATQWVLLASPGGWYGDWHPAPRRQFMFYLAGKVEIQASDGEVRTFGAGDILLAEDITGKGHISHVVSADDALRAVV